MFGVFLSWPRGTANVCPCSAVGARDSRVGGGEASRAHGSVFLEALGQAHLMAEFVSHKEMCSPWGSA